MVIHNGHLCGSYLRPAEDYSPLVVDTNGMEALPTPMKGFEPVAWRNSQILKPSRMIHLEELAECDTGDGHKPTIRFLMKKFFGIPISEGLDHA